MNMQTINFQATTTSQIAVKKVIGLRTVTIYNLGPAIIHQRWGDGDAIILDKLIEPNQCFVVEPSSYDLQGDIKIRTDSGTANVAIDLGIGT